RKAATWTADSPGERLLTNPIADIVLCCARAASGHAAADPVTTLMKSRRRIAFTKAGTTPNRTRLQQGFPIGGMGANRHLAQQQSRDRMSALGQKQTLQRILVMSALPPKADMGQHGLDVRFVPKADIAPHLHRSRIVKTTGVRSLILFL